METPTALASNSAPRATTSPWLSEFRSLLQLAVPLALAQAGYALMGLVDTAVVGRVSEQAQGAVGLGNGLFFAVSVLGIGVLMAMDPLISQAVGAGDRPRARGLLWQGVWLALLLSVGLAIPAALLPLVLKPLGADSEIATGAAHYVWARLPQLPALYLCVASRAYLQGVGRPRVMVVALIAANLANLGLDILLVFGAGPIPALGVVGSAIATAISGFLQLGIFIAGFDGVKPSSRRWDPTQISKALKVGLPIGLQMMAEVGVFALAGVLAAGFSGAAAAAHQIALAWSSLTFCFAVGVGQAAATRVGWAVGAGDQVGARRAGAAGFAGAVVLMSAAASLFWFWPRALALAMSDQPAVVDLSVGLFVVAAVFQISDGLQAVGAGALRGAGDTRFTFFANLVGHWVVGLPIAIALGVWAHGGVVGLWWGLSVGLTAVAVALVVRFWAVTRRPVKAL